MNLFLVSKVHAQEPLVSPLGEGFDDIFDVIGAFVPSLAMIVGLALLGYLFYAAFLWLTSAGQPDKLAAAQKTLVNAVIGFVLFAVMFGLFLFLSSVLGIDWATITSGATGG